MGVEEVTIGACRLLCGDAREVLPTLPLSAAIVSDPPYGIGFVHRVGPLPPGLMRRQESITGDAAPFDPTPWLAFADTLLWGANYFAHHLPPSAGWLIWDKKLGVKTDNYADGEAAWHKHGTRLRIYRYLWNGLLAREPGEKRLYVMQKPIALMQWCLSFVRPSLICDPYMGSGTTGIACVRAGRPFLGIEVAPQAFALACTRIEEAVRQGDLFRAPAAAPPAQQLSLA